MNEKGLIHIYCGNGKGKTTASIGLAIRCAGASKKVCYAHFLKGNDTSEDRLLSSIENITLFKLGKHFGFFNTLNSNEKTELISKHDKILDELTVLANSVDMIVLDEIVSAYNLNAITQSKVDNFIANKPTRLELVLTGRDPSPAWIELASYVSEINPVKHPFDDGVTARLGIEY